MLNKFFKFLKGYVIIKLYGAGTERFLNICARRNIDVGSIAAADDGTTVVRVKKIDFAKLRSVAHKTHTKVHIIKKCGFFNLKKRYKGRWMFFAGMALFVTFFTVMSQFIWSVEINGIEDTDRSVVEKILREEGIYQGAKKSGISDISYVKQRLITGTDTISWAWVYIDGAKARLEIYEKVMPPEVVDMNSPCDIVAACDGYIKSITLKNGEQIKNDGETVSAGETVIAGKVPVFREGYEENYIYVHAMGIVEAYTWHNKSGRYSTVYESRVPTGRTKRRYTLELFGKKLRLYINNGVQYEEFDSESIRHELTLPYLGFTGISLNEERYTEVSVSKEPLSIDTAVEFAKNDLEEKIAKELMYDSTLLGEEIEYEQNDAESVDVKLTMSFIEKIGTERTLEETEFDKQTDRGAGGN